MYTVVRKTTPSENAFPDEQSKKSINKFESYPLNRCAILYIAYQFARRILEFFATVGPVLPSMIRKKGAIIEKVIAGLGIFVLILELADEWLPEKEKMTDLEKLLDEKGLRKLPSFYLSDALVILPDIFIESLRDLSETKLELTKFDYLGQKIDSKNGLVFEGAIIHKIFYEFKFRGVNFYMLNDTMSLCSATSNAIWHKGSLKDLKEEFEEEITSRSLEKIKNVILDFKQTFQDDGYPDNGCKLLPRVNFESKRFNKKAKDLVLKYLNGVIENAGDRAGILIYGEPGVGKTTAAVKALSEIKNVLRIKICSSHPAHLMMLQQILEFSNALKIVLFDDVDYGSWGSKEKSESTRALLDFFGNAKYNVVIALCNSTQAHPALTRSGRFDYVIHCERPNAEEREEIFESFSAECDALTGQRKAFVEMTKDLTHADIEAIFNNMNRLKIGLQEAVEIIALNKRIVEKGS